MIISQLWLNNEKKHRAISGRLPRPAACLPAGREAGLAMTEGTNNASLRALVPTRCGNLPAQEMAQSAR
jgi:hypothetical protein